MGRQWKQWQTISLGSKITADSDCSHEIKRCLLLGRKDMTNLDIVLKSRDITLPTKVCIVKAMVFPVVVYGCESESVSCLVMPDSLRSHGLLCPTRLLCPWDFPGRNSGVACHSLLQNWMWELDLMKKVECRRIDAFEPWYWRRPLRVPWTARRSNQSILKEINTEYSLEGLILKPQYFGHLMQRADSLEKTLMLGKTEGRRRRGRQRMSG